MKDAQTIFGLFIILVIILSMGLQFRRKEGFTKYTTTTTIGSKLNYKPKTKIKGGSTNGAERYLGLGYLGTADAPKSIAFKNVFDGMPSHY